MIRKAIAGAIVALVSTTAFADDFAVKDPNLACMWCGLYVGGNAGWTWGRDAVTTTTFFSTGAPADIAAVNATSSPTLTSNGLIGGGQIGYNWQFGRAVIGLEADADFPSLKVSQGGVFPFATMPALTFTTATSVSTDWLVTVRPRIGWTEHNWLLYVTGGLAAARENVSQNVNLLMGVVLSNSFSDTQFGWTAGLGAEGKLTPNLSVKLEYLYTDLGSTPANNGVFNPMPAPISTANTSVRLTSNTVRFGLNWHLNGLTWWSAN
jgi:outer membrane immunogenic protein